MDVFSVLVTRVCADSPSLGYPSLQAPLAKRGGGIPPGRTLQAAGSQSRIHPIAWTSPTGKRSQRFPPLLVPGCARIYDRGQLHCEGAALRQLTFLTSSALSARPSAPHNGARPSVPQADSFSPSLSARRPTPHVPNRICYARLLWKKSSTNIIPSIPPFCTLVRCRGGKNGVEKRSRIAPTG